MASLPNIMLEGGQRFTCKNYNTWKQWTMTIFEYRCPTNIVLGKLTRPTVVGKNQDNFDEKDREAVMRIKLFVTYEMLIEV
jgi:hypothetical protein